MPETPLKRLPHPLRLLRFPKTGGAVPTFLLTLLVVSGCTEAKRSATSLPPPSVEPRLHFREVSREWGIDFQLGHGGRTPLTILETIGHGVGLLDFDADGRLDVILLGRDQLRIWKNVRTGHFLEVTEQMGLRQHGYWIGIGAGDFDNDGYPDIVLNGHGCLALLRNEKGKRFRDVTREAGLEGSSYFGASAGLLDLDHDGRLDIVLCRYVTFNDRSRQLCDDDGVKVTCGPEKYQPEYTAVYRNLDGKRFQNVTRTWGFQSSSGKSLGLVPLDADNDGWTDLYLANDTENGDLFQSHGGQRFENVSVRSGAAVGGEGEPLGGMGLDAQDYNRDGHQDLVITTFVNQPHCLWRNLGDGLFEDVSGVAGLASLRPLVSWGVGFTDFDNDGWLDLLYANGHAIDRAAGPTHAYAQPLRLFRGNNGRFTEETLTAELRQPLVGRGSAFGDLDNDGRVDAVVSNLEGKTLILHNVTPTPGNWLSLKLVGNKSNRQGLGAQVKIVAADEVWNLEAKTARSIYSASDSRLHVGIGEKDRLDRIEVRWPSGRRSLLENIPANRQIEVREP